MTFFTNYEAEKFFTQNDEGIIEDKLLMDDKFLEPQELSKMLDISESTANNWLNKRNDISNLGEQAILYHLLKDLINTQKYNLKSNILVNNNDIFEIYRRTDKDTYELLATTKDIHLARTIQNIHKVYDALSYSIEFIQQEINSLQDYGVECGGYKRELINIKDLIHYINKGETYSKAKEERQKKDMEEFIKNLDELEKSENKQILSKDIDNIQNSEINSDSLYIQTDDKKLYDAVIPNGALIKYEPLRTRNLKYRGICLYVKKLKDNCYQTEKVTRYGKVWEDYKDYFGENNVGKKYPSLLSAFVSLLYTRSKSVNTTEETEYSLDNGKTWKSTSNLKMTEEEYQQFLLQK